MEPEPTYSDDGMQPPARLRALTSWQASKVSLLGTRMTAQHMPLTARADFAVLAALEEYGELSQADLGRRLGLDRNEISGIVTRLHRDHHLDRHVDPDNRRRNVVTLTASGKRYLEEIQHHTDTVQNELLVGLTAAERRQLNALLTKLLSSHKTQSA
ncbi:MarR family winged helix-turn-helix transcriptional regulator [Actinoallomurus soli]|uniref:MarR family winged helix-turn-helix transcriptional regulator n=1 Tax=Actinoallomurus soli TaxID=2952535 RepID=UPI00209212E3|nr:MarR family winged helix-turn-helix transcriptional regulator [Actinoallomurus soli]MCO5973626.1 MarR family winged helix-turn-helix transcriptional regulator [Actinoallomurus soli]